MVMTTLMIVPSMVAIVPSLSVVTYTTFQEPGVAVGVVLVVALAS